MNVLQNSEYPLYIIFIRNWGGGGVYSEFVQKKPGVYAHALLLCEKTMQSTVHMQLCVYNSNQCITWYLVDVG